MKKVAFALIAVCVLTQPAHAGDFWSKARDRALKHIPVTIPGTSTPIPVPTDEVPLPKMVSYCVTYSDMTGRNDAAGRERIRYRTIHVRGGRDLAKTIAYGKFGEKNVLKIADRNCSEEYARR